MTRRAEPTSSPVVYPGDEVRIQGGHERFRVVGFELGREVVVLEELHGRDLFHRDRFAVYRWRVRW